MFLWLRPRHIQWFTLLSFPNTPTFIFSIRVICQPNCLKAHIEARNSSVALHDFALDQKIVIAQLKVSSKVPKKKGLIDSYEWWALPLLLSLSCSSILFPNRHHMIKEYYKYNHSIALISIFTITLLLRFIPNSSTVINPEAFFVVVLTL